METTLKPEKPGDPVMAMWGKLVDLHIFHDTLKQDRLRLFLPFQLGLMAGFALSVQALISPIQDYAVPDLGYRIIWFTFALGFCYMGYAYARRTIHMDNRSGDYVRTIKNQLRHFETRLKPSLGDVDMLPYEGQFKVLNDLSMMLDSSGNYHDMRRSCEARNPELRGPDSRTKSQVPAHHHRSAVKKALKVLVVRPAAFHETRVLQTVLGIWMVAFVCLITTMAFTLQSVPGLQSL